MTNKELIAKIRAEIERLKEVNRKIKCQANERYCSGYDDAFMDLFPFLSTIESEKPLGLVEEVKRYYSDNFAYISSDQPTLSILTNVARHFAKWGEHHAKEKMRNARRTEEAYQEVAEDMRKQIDGSSEIPNGDKLRYCVEYINPRFPLLDNGGLNVRHLRVPNEHWAEMAITLILSFGGKIYALYRGNVKDGKLADWPTPMIVESEDWFTDEWLHELMDCGHNCL